MEKWNSLLFCRQEGGLLLCILLTPLPVPTRHPPHGGGTHVNRGLRAESSLHPPLSEAKRCNSSLCLYLSVGWKFFLGCPLFSGNQFLFFTMGDYLRVLCGAG